MKTKILTLAVSLNSIKVHESILDFNPNDEIECKLVAKSLRHSIGLVDYSLFHFIDGKSHFYLNKGKDFDKLNSSYIVDFTKTRIFTSDYNEIKALLLEEIKSNYIPPDGENVFHLHYN